MKISIFPGRISVMPSRTPICHPVIVAEPRPLFLRHQFVSQGARIGLAVAAVHLPGGFQGLIRS